MGALTGRMSPLGFFVKGKVDSWENVLQQLIRHRFQDLDPSTGVQQSFGWTLLADPFSTEFDKPSIFYGEHLVGLSLRIDTISVPASQVKLRLQPRAREVAAAAGKERLSKGEMNQLREDLQAELMRKSLPTIKAFELLYHSATGRVWFFGKSKGVLDVFLELFYETFGVILIPDDPYTVSAQHLTEDEAELLLALEPTAFFDELA